MKPARLTIVAISAALIIGCSKEPPARTVHEFMENPLLLEAALVRCTQTRAESRYQAECVNAREAVKLIEAKEAEARQAELEEQSRRKREALRRTQQAAAEARRRAAEARRRQEEAEYLAQFGEPLPDAATDGEAQTGNEPVAVLPAPADAAGDQAGSDDVFVTYGDENVAEPPDVADSNAPVAVIEEEPEAEEPPTADLSSIRDELRRRNETDGSESSEN